MGKGIASSLYFLLRVFRPFPNPALLNVMVNKLIGCARPVRMDSSGRIPIKQFAGQQNYKIMIHDCTNGQLDKIKAFAKENHLSREFVSTFSRFKLKVKQGYEVFLYPDWAPMSLSFQYKYKGKNDLNGGFIFHGVHDGGGNGGAPTFSVELNPSTKPHWSIHT